jgi:hypothetical protein
MVGIPVLCAAVALDIVAACAACGAVEESGTPFQSHEAPPSLSASAVQTAVICSN